MIIPSGFLEDGVLGNRLQAGLPRRVQDQALQIAGEFDEVVSRLENLSIISNPQFDSVRKSGETHSERSEGTESCGFR